MAKRYPQNDIKKLYPLLIECGLIITLLLLIGLVHVRVPEKPLEQTFFIPQEGAPLILPPATKNEPVLVPPPPLPHVSVNIPDDTPIELPPLEFDEFDIVTKLEVPPLEQEIEIEIDYDRLKKIEVLPELIGGEEAFRRSIHYPQHAINAGVQGIVEVEFIVNKKGRVLKPRIVKGIGGGCDQAVLKAIKQQKYTPGVKDGAISEFLIKEIVQFIIIEI